MRLVFCLAFALSACSAPLVRCDKHLQPINAPPPKAQSVAAGKSL